MKKKLSAALCLFMAFTVMALPYRATIEEAKSKIESGTALKPIFKHRSITPNKISVAQNDAETSKLIIQKENTAHSSPMRLTAGGGNIFAYLGYTTSEDTPIGLYTLEPKGYNLKWADPAYIDEGFVLSSGWLADEKLCGFAPVEFYGYIIDLYYFEYNFETGEILKDVEADMSKGMFSTATYNSTDNCIYGYGSDESDNIAFIKAKASSPDALECVRVIENIENACLSITYNRQDNTMYGITTGGTLVRIATDGTLTEVMKLDGITASEFVSGLVYSPLEDVFYWNLISNDTSRLYKINATDKTTEMIDDFGSNATFPIMFTTDEKIDPAAPATPTIVKTDFAEGANSGSMTYRMPTQTEGGDNITGKLEWTMLLDNSEYRTGTADSGSEVKIDFTDLTDGMHTFDFYVESDSKTSRRATVRMYIGKDTPTTPANVKLTDKEVSWSAVSAGINGGYINLQNIEYEVFLNDKSLGTTKETKMSISIPEANYQSYEASVVAICDNKQSTPGKSNVLLYGKPFTPDVSFTPTEEEARLFTIVDVDNNDNTWIYDIMYDVPSFTTDYDDYNDMNDWLFLPPIQLSDPDIHYLFSMAARRRGSSYTEDYVEVCIGTYPDPTSMTSVIIPKTVPEYSSDWEVWGELSNLFKVKEAGTYYIGIHCLSAPGQYGVVVRNISVCDKGITDNSPAAVTDLHAEGAGNGVLEATVSFTFPVQTITGTAIAADTDLCAIVKGNTTVRVNGKAGEKGTATVGTTQGTNTISVIVSAGDSNGAESVTEVFTGQHIPNVVRNLSGTVSDDMLSFTMTWEAPVDGEDGGYIDPADTEYLFYTHDGTWGWQQAAQLGKNVNTYTFSIPAGSEQDLYRFGIATSNIAGLCSRVTGLTSIMGKPYALPMSEVFEGNADDPFQINPWTYYTPTDEYNGQRWAVSPLKSLSDSWSELSTSALVGTSSNTTGKGKMGIPRFSASDGSNMEIMLDAWTGKDAATISVTGIASGMTEEVKIGTIAPSNGWKKAFIELPAEFNGKAWVQLYIEAEYKTAREMCVIESLEVSGNTSGIINAASPEGTVRGGHGEIIVSGFENANIFIYSIDGKTVATKEIAKTEEHFALSSGIYIVRIQDRTYKLIVK